MFELRRYGKCVVRGDDFSNITSGFIVPLDTLVFRQATTVTTRDMLDTQWALSTSLEPDIEFDESYKDGDDPRGSFVISTMCFEQLTISWSFNVQ